jgi:hypothetical protein
MLMKLIRASRVRIKGDFMASETEKMRQLRYMHTHFVRGVYRLLLGDALRPACVSTDPSDESDAQMHFMMAVTHLELARLEPET